MEDLKLFWDVKATDPCDESGAEGILRVVRKAIRLHALSVFTTGTMVVLSPLVAGWGRILPLVSWFPRNYSYGYEVISSS